MPLILYSLNPFRLFCVVFFTEIIAKLGLRQPGSLLIGAGGCNSWSKKMRVVMRERSKFPDRKIEPLDLRRKRQVLEASQAMKDYKHTQQAVRERMAALRDERLTRDAQEKA